MPNGFRRTVELFVESELSPAARARRLSDFARKDVAGLVATGRASATYHRFVDGAESDADDTVRRVILYEWAYVGEAAAFGLAFLQARAPIASGQFRDAFVVAVDGRMIGARDFRPQSVPAGAEVLIANREPQSRKIDTGFVGRGRVRFSSPPGLFNDAAAAVRARFGNSVAASRLSNVTYAGKYILKRGGRAGSAVKVPHCLSVL